MSWDTISQNCALQCKILTNTDWLGLEIKIPKGLLLILHVLPWSNCGHIHYFEESQVHFIDGRLKRRPDIPRLDEHNKVAHLCRRIILNLQQIITPAKFQLRKKLNYETFLAESKVELVAFSPDKVHVEQLGDTQFHIFEKNSERSWYREPSNNLETTVTARPRSS